MNRSRIRKPRIRTLGPKISTLKPSAIGMVKPLEVERIRGRAGMARRERVLARDPLCKACELRGIFTASHHADHVIPLHLGGPDHEANMQGLCDPCHADKTAREQADRAAGTVVIINASQRQPVMA